MGKSSRSGRRTLGPRRLSARAPASRWLREFTASYSTQLRRSPRCSRPVTEIRTRRWGSATGRSRSAKASRTLKAAVLKPIAKASEATANAVTPGFRANTRTAARSSRRMVSIWGLYAADPIRLTCSRPYRGLPHICLQDLLAQPDAERRDFHKLVVADEFDGLLQVENSWRHQAYALVGGGSAHVGELLFLDYVDVEIGIAGVLAYGLAAVHLGTGRNENLAAFLEVEDGVAGGPSRTVRHQRAGGARGNVALPLDVAVEQRIHNRSAARIREDFAAQADQPARGHVEIEPHAAGAVVDHLDHLPLAGAQ